MTVPEIFILTRGERDSAVWQKLLKKMQQMLASAREQNDRLQHDNMTNELRGQIGILKALIALNEDRPPYDG